MGIFTPNNKNPEETTQTPPTPEKTIAEQIAEGMSVALQPVIASQAAIASRLETVENSTRRPAAPEPTPGEPASVFDDENAAFAQRIGPVVQRQLETEARLAFNEVKSEYVAKGYGEAIVAFGTDIQKVLEESPLVNGNKLCRGDATYIRNVIDMVFGREALKKGLKFGGRDRGFFTETAGSDGGNVESGPKNDGLTDGQRKVFARMGVKSEDATKTMGKLKFIS